MLGRVTKINNVFINSKNEIVVPKGIRYIGLWEDFELFDFPYILDKKIPGCGFTEYCITSPEFNTILCSPRKILLENKHDQHPNDTFLVENEYDPSPGIDRDLVCVKPDVTGWDDEEAKKKVGELEKNRVSNKIRIELEQYIERMGKEGKPIKILVTYDSFRIVKRILGKSIVDYRVIIDEFQSIFTDSRFKSTTELGFVTELQDVQKVCYVSATPMMKEYLSAIEEFKDLPYYELDWSTDDPDRIIKPKLHVKNTRSVNEAAKKVIDKYLSGEYEKVYRNDISVVESKEAVFFVNSVNNIIGIIKACELKPEQCNILVANTNANSLKIKKKLGKKFEIGKVPLRNEPRKMFTFCTRTVYLGADFYSDNARSFIISDANIQTLAVDISLDLPQILGRQRLLENPWRNEAYFYYKPLTKDIKMKIDRQTFDKAVEKKIKTTESLMKVYSNQYNLVGVGDEERENQLTAYLDMCERDVKNTAYKFDYLAVNIENNERVLALNRLVILAERRAYDIQLIDYQDRFSVFNAIDTQFGTGLGDEIQEFFGGYNACGRDMEKRLKYICELDISDEKFESFKSLVDAKTRSYLDLGKKLLKANSYKSIDLDRVVHDRNTNLDDFIYSEFKEGDKLINTDLKKRIQEIYYKNNMRSRKALATDIKSWFDIKIGKFKDSVGKWKHGIELLKRLK